MLEKIIDFICGKLTYQKFIHSNLQFQDLSSENQQNLVLELQEENLTHDQILYILNNKKDLSYSIRISELKDFPIYFYDNPDEYLKEVISYVEDNNIPKQYHFEIVSILRNYLKIKGEYVLDSELSKFINKEIPFEKIKNRFDEVINNNLTIII